jgi:hypothetical protein
VVQVQLSALRALADAIPRRDVAALASEIRSHRTSAYGGVADDNWSAGLDLVLADLETRYGGPLP